MQRSVRLAAAVAATSVVAVAGAPSALATPAAGEFGGHVAMCAQEHLGSRENAPAVTCMGMTFPTFGAMALHMQQHDQ